MTNRDLTDFANEGGGRAVNFDWPASGGWMR